MYYYIIKFRRVGSIIQADLVRDVNHQPVEFRSEEARDKRMEYLQLESDYTEAWYTPVSGEEARRFL